MRRIMRTVQMTICFGQRVNALGEYVDVCEDLEGIHDRAEAQKRLRRKYKDDTIIIAKVESYEGTYVLSGEDFLKYAKCIEDNLSIK